MMYLTKSTGLIWSFTLAISLAPFEIGLAADVTDQELFIQLHGKKIEASEHWMGLTPDQQAAAIAKANGTYDALSPRVKSAWNAMTAEEQQAAIGTATARGKTATERTRSAYEGLSTEQQQQLRQDNIELRQERRINRQSNPTPE
jgi:hypothetical protein